MKKILAVGDCITLGVGECVDNSYIEKVGKQLNAPVKNRGYTMSTTREGIALLNDSLTVEYDLIFLQFGLADSYFTVRHAPYIPYYPDNFLRKQIRSIVKKYKKSLRNMGLYESVGVSTVVPKTEYRANYQHMINYCSNRLIILPETIPHHETYRNDSIQQYNSILQSLADEYENCHMIPLFDKFLSHFTDFYLDPAHPNDDGYEWIATTIIKYLQDHRLLN